MQTILRIHRPRSLLKNLWALTNPNWGVVQEDSRMFWQTEIDVENIGLIVPPRLRDREVRLEKWLEKISTKRECLPLSAQVGFSLRQKSTQHLLEHLRVDRGVTELDFPGTIFHDARGVHCIFRLWYHKGWNYSFWSLGWPTSCPSAILVHGQAVAYSENRQNKT